jgi:peptidyl-prolyl cis-trans isomerase B (cyclophilin B)
MVYVNIIVKPLVFVKNLVRIIYSLIINIIYINNINVFEFYFYIYFLFFIFYFLNGCQGDGNANNSVGTPHTNEAEKIMNKKITIKTSKGNIDIDLNSDKAPTTVANFLDKTRSDFYNGTIFHRVIDGFMIQGGGFNENMNQIRELATIQNKADNGLRNDRGTITMARTNDPHSATCQFFINLVDNSFLNFTGYTPRGWGYAVFGKVTKGMNVVDEIAKVKTGIRNGHQKVPLEPIIINSVIIVE